MSSSTETFDKLQTFYNNLNPFLDISSKKSICIVVSYIVLIFIPYIAILSILSKRQGISIDQSKDVEQNEINDICLNTRTILNIDTKKSTLTYVKIGAFMNFILYILLTLFVGLRFINLCQTTLSDNVTDIFKFGFLTCTFIVLSIVNSILSFILMDVSDDTLSNGIMKKEDSRCYFDYKKDNNDTSSNFCNQDHPYCINNECYTSKQTLINFGNWIQYVTYFNLAGGGLVLLVYTYLYMTIQRHNSEGIFEVNRSLLGKIRNTVNTVKTYGNKFGFFLLFLFIIVVIFSIIFYFLRDNEGKDTKNILYAVTSVVIFVVMVGGFIFLAKS